MSLYTYRSTRRGGYRIYEGDQALTYPIPDNERHAIALCDSMNAAHEETLREAGIPASDPRSAGVQVPLRGTKV